MVRVRGGNFKLRALRLHHGNFSWRSEHCTAKTRVIDVVYNAANDEYVRTKTLTKNAIVLIDGTPFKDFYRKRYNIDISQGSSKLLEFSESVSSKEKQKIQKRRKSRVLPADIESQFKQNRIMACVSSKPGQVGRADGYILEGDELEFYIKKIAARHKK